MKVTLSKYGGWMATLPPRVAIVTTEALPEGAARELSQLVAAAKAEQPPIPSQQAGRAYDVMDYELVVDDGDKQEVLSRTDTTLTEAFAALMTWIEHHSAEK